MEGLVRVFALGNSRLFAGVPLAVLEELASLARVIPLPAGVALLRAGERADYLFVVQSGILSVDLPVTHGEVTDVTVDVRMPGDVVGSECLLTHTTYSYTVRGLTDAELLALAAEPLRKILRGTPVAEETVYRNLTMMLASLWSITALEDAEETSPHDPEAEGRVLDDRQIVLDLLRALRNSSGATGTVRRDLITTLADLWEITALERAEEITLHHRAARCPVWQDPQVMSRLSIGDIRAHCLKNSVCPLGQGSYCPHVGTDPQRWHEVRQRYAARILQRTR